MKTKRRKQGFFILAMFWTCSLALFAQDNNPIATAKAFVAKCLNDTNVFVANPPDDPNSHQRLTPEGALASLENDANRHRSLLWLFTNGLPADFKTLENFREHGLQKTWYQNGCVRSDEKYEHGKLMSGSYFDKTGKMVGEIKNGSGVKVVLTDDYNGAGGRICGTIDYVGGLKHGTDVSYIDYEKGLKSDEWHYKQGELDGVLTRWQATGEKFMEEYYKDGVPFGVTTSWFKNGQIQSISESSGGLIVGTQKFFYEDGVPAMERSDKSMRRWCPSGQLMVEELYDDQGKLSSGRSFDSLGHQNGWLTNGLGTLIYTYEGTGGRPQEFSVYRYAQNVLRQQIGLPRIFSTYQSFISTNELDFTLKVRVPLETAGATGTVSIVLPKDCASDGPLQFSFANLEPGSNTNLGRVRIALPRRTAGWKGAVSADLQGLVAGHKVRYQQLVFEISP